MRLSPVRSRRGFSLIEAAVVLGIITLLALMLIPRLNLQRGTADDAGAQGTIEAALDAEQVMKGRQGAFVDPADPASASRLSAINPEITFLGGTVASQSNLDASIALDVNPSLGTEVVGIAVKGSADTCWYTRRDYAALAGSPTVLRAFSEGAMPKPCTGAAALTLTRDPAAPEVGKSWERPLNFK